MLTLSEKLLLEIASYFSPSPFACNLARRYLGWRPVEDEEEFLERVLRPMATGVAPD